MNFTVGLTSTKIRKIRKLPFSLCYHVTVASICKFSFLEPSTKIVSREYSPPIWYTSTVLMLYILYYMYEYYICYIVKYLYTRCMCTCIVIAIAVFILYAGRHLVLYTVYIYNIDYNMWAYIMYTVYTVSHSTFTTCTKIHVHMDLHMYVHYLCSVWTIIHMYIHTSVRNWDYTLTKSL